MAPDVDGLKATQSPGHETTPTKPRTPQTPKRSAAVKRRNASEASKHKLPPAPAGQPTPESQPKRNASAQKDNPKARLARAATKSKKAEPTLLGDFLLGRPTPARQQASVKRRKSLEIVKAEMRAATVQKLQPPGGVKDRVKQWQKENAAAVGSGDNLPPSEPDADDILSEGMDEAGEKERMRIRRRESRAEAKNRVAERANRKAVETKEPSAESDAEDVMEGNTNGAKSSGKAPGTPKKRVVSDDHWMQTKTKKNTPTREPLTHTVKTLPRNFVQKNSRNQPLAEKLGNWLQQVEEPELRLHSSDNTETRETARHKSQNGCRRVVSPIHADGARKTLATDSGCHEEGTEITPEVKVIEDNIGQASDAPEVKGILADRERGSSRRRVPHGGRNELESPRRSSGKHKRAQRHSVSATSDDDDQRKEIPDTPTHQRKSSRRKTESTDAKSLADVPVGLSAFSVLDLPIGADAHTMRSTMRRPSQWPNRQSSFKAAVPSVLKKVFTGALEMAHDTMGDPPPRGGVNQPATIESWLNGTTDPFLDNPTSSLLDTSASDSTSCREMSQDPSSAGVTNATERDIKTTKSESHPSHERLQIQAMNQENENKPPAELRESSLHDIKTREMLQKAPPSLSPNGLKRSPATRDVSSSTRRIPLRERVAEAFRGESVTVRSAEVAEERSTRLHSIREAVNDTPRSSPRHSPKSNSPLSDLPDHNSTEFPSTKGLPHRPLREVPTTGMHRLSTIASVETFACKETYTETSLGSLPGKSTRSKGEGSSHTSSTTITQRTSQTGYTSNSSYTNPTDSSISRGRSHKRDKPELKRRLTKHSDLMSVLSLPDAEQQRSGSIRSARSIRTTRSRLEDATIEGLLQELAIDEVKYMRELKTLVDGVIPVLLTCVLSKSDSAIAAGLFNPHAARDTDQTATKPIVDMGVALEKLKSLHKRIPLENPDQLTRWAFSAHKVYEAYLSAWRMGFKDVIVNLAPASQNSTGGTMEDIPRNAEGDIVDASGDRVDVAFLLKRPLVRVKHLAKIVKGINSLLVSDETLRLHEMYQALLAETRRRAKEEEARQEDLAANNIDPSRARDPSTLAPVDGVLIDRTRQVYMKDFFSLDLQHSSGQRIDCKAEILLRDKPKATHDEGDVLICEVDTNGRWLLLPPIGRHHISARKSFNKAELVVLIRGGDDIDDWSELITLTAEDEDTAMDWITALGTTPVPPPVKTNVEIASEIFRKQSVLSLTAPAVMDPSLSCSTIDVEIPIGERKKPSFSTQSQQSESLLKERIRTNCELQDHVSDVNRKSMSSDPSFQMSGGLGEVSERRKSPIRYHNKVGSPKSPLTADKIPSEVLPTSDNASGTVIPALELLQKSEHRKSSNTAGFTPEANKEQLHGAVDSPHEISPRTVFPPRTARDRVVTEDPSSPSSPTEPGFSPRKAPLLQSLAAKFRGRRSSSPLKHEYQPSNASGTSESEASDDYSDSYTESSDDEELEAPDFSLPAPVPPAHHRSRPSSIYSLPNDSLAPSNSASQGPFRQTYVPSTAPKIKLVASISSWSDKGRWEQLSPEDCSIVVGAGIIEAFTLSLTPFNGNSGRSDLTAVTDDANERPLVALDLTPLVPLRQSTLVDIEIRSPPLPRSIFKWSGSIRFRTHTIEDCNKLYAAIHRARLDNPVFKRLEQERLVNSYGGQTYHGAQSEKRRSNFFGRKNSYRATERAPSVSTSDNQSSGSITSAFMKRITSRGSFNIARSTVHAQSNTRGTSPATSLYTDSASGYTPPRTPASESLAETSVSKIMARGTRDIKIRCYKLVTMSSWGLDVSARLTIEDPPRGMRQASTLYHGMEKRILVTAKVPRNNKNDKLQKTPGLGLESPNLFPPDSQGANVRRSAHSRRVSLSGVIAAMDKDDDSEGAQQYYTVLDTVIGGHCVLRYGRTGIAINVWEETTGPNGEVGMVGAVGGVSGRTRKWMFHFNSQEEMTWIYAVLGGR